MTVCSCCLAIFLFSCLFSAFYMYLVNEYDTRFNVRLKTDYGVSLVLHTVQTSPAVEHSDIIMSNILEFAE